MNMSSSILWRIHQLQADPLLVIQHLGVIKRHSSHEYYSYLWLKAANLIFSPLVGLALTLFSALE